MVKKGLILLLLWLSSTPLWAFDHQHQGLAQVLAEAVHPLGAASTVDYRWLKTHEDQLDDYLKQISDVQAATYGKWSEAEQIAFLINSYNGLTLKLILSKYPRLKSIKDLGGFFSGPWKVEFFTLLGEIHTLDSLEHGWLRAKFKEPRVHFAIVCGSVGCPALSERPYVASSLGQQLQQAKLRFLGDRSRNRYDPGTQTLYLSKIFDWFAEDFKAQSGSVAAFVAEGLIDDPEQQQKIKAGLVEIEYLSYDWSLNQSATP